MSAEITLLAKHGIDPLMSKRIFLDDEGKPKSDGSGCYMAHGAATRRAAASAGALAQIIAECGSNQAIALGSLAAGLPDPATIVSKQRLKDNPGAISRSRDFIDYGPGEPGWALIDFDMKGMPTHVSAAIEARGGMWNALLAVAPGLARAARVSRASTILGRALRRVGRPHPASAALPADRRQRRRSPLPAGRGCRRRRALSARPP
jgi:hypothetical protein